MNNRSEKEGWRLGSIFRAFFALIFLAAALQVEAAAQEPAAPEPIAVVPYRIDYDGLITVSATVNGRGPFDFVIDTGATLTIAFQNLAAIQSFEPTGGARRRVLGISGSSDLETFRFGDIAVGSATMPDHVGVVIPDWEAPRKTPAGIIGIDFLKRYAVVFDVGERTMSLYPHGSGNCSGP